MELKSGCQQCAGCGEWFPEYDMVRIFTGGTRAKFWCRDCYAQGSRRVDQNNYLKKTKHHEKMVKKGKG